MKDLHGLAISTHSPEIVAAINHFTQNIIKNGPEVMAVIDAAKAHPSNLLLQCYAATVYLYAQNSESTNKAKEYLLQASKFTKDVSNRERMIFHAIREWSLLNYSTAVQILTEITGLYPQDLLCAKVAEWLFFLLGQKHTAADFLAMCNKMNSVNNTNPYFLSMLSFALELSGQRARAIDTANEAIAIEINTPWAHHTLAHVYLFEGLLSTGKKRLSELQKTWDGISPLLQCHNNWHLGLFYLGDRDQQRVIELYEQRIWGNNPDTVTEQIDAIAYLWRMDMAGISSDGRWGSIQQYSDSECHANQITTAFGCMHFIYASTKHGDKRLTQSIIEASETFAASRPESEQRQWLKISLPVIRATRAFAQENYQVVIQILEPIMLDIFCIGGSDAQLEILQQMYFISLLKTKKNQRASEYFQQNLSFYSNSPLAEYWFSGFAA